MHLILTSELFRETFNDIYLYLCVSWTEIRYWIMNTKPIRYKRLPKWSWRRKSHFKRWHRIHNGKVKMKRIHQFFVHEAKWRKLETWICFTRSLRSTRNHKEILHLTQIADSKSQDTPHHEVDVQKLHGNDDIHKQTGIVILRISSSSFPGWCGMFHEEISLNMIYIEEWLDEKLRSRHESECLIEKSMFKFR